ncbi:MAG: Uma2 family endonuclease [Calothrix sp. FI2-JRJ7]|jgi:Uma2 family endonuclease|nr:Uma2 family endonuclease [Calothrix sp. FI2-JRJ7]
MSIQVIDQPLEERVVTLRGVTWERFKAIEAPLLDNHDVKLTYLAGVLEIMSPIGREHEYIKSTLSLLLETYMRKKGVRFYKRGGFTLEAPGYASGTPDESYCIGRDKQIPDIVIEVIVSSGTINRKELYKPLRVPEVWFWKSGELRIFQLDPAAIHVGEHFEYKEVDRSRFFPDLDRALLLKYLGYTDQYDAVKDFRKELRDGEQPT